MSARAADSAASSGGGGGGGESFITLVSAERHKFIVERRVAQVSGLVRAMLSSSAFVEAAGVMEFPEIPGHVLELVVSYMVYKTRHQNARAPIPAFHIPPENALELLQAANYLDL